MSERVGAAGGPGDMPAEEFAALAREVADWCAGYLERVGERPVLAPVEPGTVRERLPAAPPDVGEPLADALRDFDEIVVPALTHWNHPGFFGYFSITGSGPGVLAEMLAASLNVNAMVWQSSPAATELEELTTDWLRQLMALPEPFDGVINDTASSSSLYALAAAREVAYPEQRTTGMFGLPPGRIYASDQAHSSIEKAVLTLGFGRDGFAAIPSDDRFQMDVGALRRTIEADVAAGRRPVAVVPTVGTTSSASVDPVREVVEIAREFGMWVHVDAAYAGPAAIVPELAEHFDGWADADSIVVNPHKWLFTPVDCSILYCRRPDDLVRAFSIVPEYLTSKDGRVGRNLMDYGVSLGRRFRSLKLWFVLRYFGREGIVERLRHHVALAHGLAEAIRSEPDWVVVAPVHFSTAAFRYAPDGVSGEEADAMNHRILREVNGAGEVFLTHTVLGGRVALRLSIGNLRTQQDRVDRAWTLLREAAAAL